MKISSKIVLATAIGILGLGTLARVSNAFQSNDLTSKMTQHPSVQMAKVGDGDGETKDGSKDKETNDDKNGGKEDKCDKNDTGVDTPEKGDKPDTKPEKGDKCDTEKKHKK